MEKDPNNPVKEYTGVWIPREIMECDELNAIEKIAYGEIACFNVCYASNAWLAKRIGRSEEVASRCVNKLIRLGFLENCGFNGRFRQVRVVKNGKGSQKRQGRVVKNEEAVSSKMTTIEKSKEKSKDIVTNVTIGASADLATYGNSEINEMFEQWKEMFGYDQKNSKANRYACATMLRSKEKGKDWLLNTMKIMRESMKDRYAGKLVNGNAGFADLQKNYAQIWHWGRKQWEVQKELSEIDLGDIK